jgi:Protein of unknown function (DUF4238)
VEKHAFVSYLGNLHKRVTKREQRIKPTWDRFVADFPWTQLQHDFANAGLSRTALKVDRFHELFEQGMPEPIRQTTILMEYDRTAKKLREMTWRFLVADASEAFVTSDNPMYLGPTSFFVPFGSHVALLGQMNGPDDCTAFPVDAAGVNQCNHVTISEADEHVYSHQPAQWIVDAFNAAR